jgi:hypothetical protein
MQTIMMQQEVTQTVVVLTTPDSSNYIKRKQKCKYGRRRLRSER